MDKNFDHFGSPDPGSHSHSEGVGANLFADAYSDKPLDGGRRPLTACENIGAFAAGIGTVGGMVAGAFESASILEAVGLGVLVGAEAPALAVIAIAGGAALLTGAMATDIACNGPWSGAAKK